VDTLLVVRKVTNGSYLASSCRPTRQLALAVARWLSVLGPKVWLNDANTQFRGDASKSINNPVLHASVVRLSAADGTRSPEVTRML